MTGLRKARASFEWLTLDDCRTFAFGLATIIDQPICIALVGTLGAGKTQFVRFFVEAMHGDPTVVSSPTFVLVNQYHARIPIAHLDLYRLESVRELDSIGFDDLVFGEAICLIEWADKFASAMPEETLWIDISVSESGRHVELSCSADTLSERVIQDLVRTQQRS